MKHLALTLLAAFILLALLAKFGPKNSKNAFWTTLFRVRDSSGRVFTILFIALLVLSAAAVVIGTVSNKASEGSTSSLSSDAITTIILCIFYFCLKDLGKSAKRGEVCECCGDCSKCRIQCTSNEKYYGLSHGKKK